MRIIVKRIEEILCREMASVLECDIPVSCESTLMRRWSKDAKSEVRDGQVYPVEKER